MCGRFALYSDAQIISEHFGLAEIVSLLARYNIAPTQAIAVIRLRGEDLAKRLDLLRWGLIPSWAKDVNMGAKIINARAETVMEKPTFRTAFKGQ